MPDSPPTPLFTVGHSNHEIGAFLDLLRSHGITAIADVRSTPYSRRNPQFNRETLREALTSHGFEYVFMGDQLGARRTEPEAYVGERVSYAKTASLPAFQDGLDRIRRGTTTHRIAMMCAEKDPLTCHRFLLVCRHLRDEFEIDHIREDGLIETMDEAETRLIGAAGLSMNDLFRNRAELLGEAYDRVSEDS